MKLIVHVGTGTVIDADDKVFVIDTDAIHDEALGKLLEDGDEADVVNIAKEKGRRISSDLLELTYGNCMAFTPTALKQEIEENTFVTNKLNDGVAQWLRNATAEEYQAVADAIINDELLWQYYCEIVADAMNNTYHKINKGTK